MPLTGIRDHERDALMKTLRELGPDAPTLCSDWQAADLAAHLVVSEAYRGWPMIAAYGLRRGLPASLTQRGMRSLQALGDRQLRRAKRHGWDWLLERLAAGPPPAYRRPGVAPIRLVEEWVHHEDLRRANDKDPRPSSPAVDEALWQAGGVLAAFPEFLPGREGIEVSLPDGRSQLLGTVERVRVQGAPGEVLLFLSGRTSAARVEVTGAEQDLHHLRLVV